MNSMSTAETYEREITWARDSLANADVVAAHEKTMFLHRVAILGAMSIKDLIDGEEKRGDTTPVEWGRVHSLGPIREWTPSSWKSTRVFIGETEEDDLGLPNEFMILSVNGTIDTRTSRSVRGLLKRGKITEKTETLIGEDYTINRYLGNTEKSVIVPNLSKGPVTIDREYTCRDVRDHFIWTPEEQIRDYESRSDEIAIFMDELSILASSTGKGYEITRYLDAGHIRVQLDKISDCER